MPVAVTDFRIDRVEIPERKFYELPHEAQQLIRAYATPVRSSNPDVLAFDIAIYRWAEINSAITKATGGVS